MYIFCLGSFFFKARGDDPCPPNSEITDLSVCIDAVDLFTDEAVIKPAIVLEQPNVKFPNGCSYFRGCSPCRPYSNAGIGALRPANRLQSVCLMPTGNLFFWFEYYRDVQGKTHIRCRFFYDDD